ncbi:MAG: hypothetical protein HY718_10860 [Planctomycetes bacterium]|nr:hypothetical protein [Planctomycetota bacterium]
MRLSGPRWSMLLVLPPLLMIACREEDELPSAAELREAARRLAESRENEAPAGSQPASQPVAIPRMALPHRAGSMEWEHEAGEEAARVRFRDARSAPLTGVQSGVVWLASSTGPQQVPLEPCQPAETGCFTVMAELLRDHAVRGVLRCERAGERFCLPLPAWDVESAAPASASDSTRPAADRTEQSPPAERPDQPADSPPPERAQRGAPR